MNLSNTVSKRKGILMPVFVLIFLTDATSQTLGTWAFNGSTAGVAGSYNTVSNADFSPSITNKGYSGSVYYGETNWPPGAINTGQYFQFSLTPGSGNALNLLSVVMGMRRSSTGSPAGSGPQSFSIRSSLDNYTLDLLTGSLSSNIANYTIFPIGFNLLASVITFRVYGFNAATTSGGLNRLVFDNISVTGSNIILAGSHSLISAKNQDGKINVSVSLKDIFGSDTYTIERSTDANHFIAVNKIDLAKTVNDIYNYSDMVNNYNGKLYYRLNIKKENGRVEYSNIATINVEKPSTKLKMFANGNTVTFSSDITGPCTFTLFSLSGTCLYKKKIENAALTYTIVLPRFPAGIYYGSLAGNKIVRTASIKLDTTY